MSLLKKLSGCSILVSLAIGSIGLQTPAFSQATQAYSPVQAKKQYNQESRNEELRKSEAKNTKSKAAVQPGQGMGSQNSYGFGMSESSQQMAMQTNPTGGGGGSGQGGGAQVMVEMLDTDTYWEKGQYNGSSAGEENSYTGVYDSFLKRTEQIEAMKMPTPGDNDLSAGDFQMGGGGGGGGGGAAGNSNADGKEGGKPLTAAGDAVAKAHQAGVGAQKAGDPAGSSNQSKCNSQGCSSAAASSAGEDAIQCLMNAMDGMTLNLINVANEDAGTPCASNQISKTYSNAVWMVQRMYKTCFLPMAILFLLPGALITNIKTFIGFGILHNNNDEDAVSPWTGILRSIIAIFLIPMTQVVVSYMVDVGNSLQNACQPYVNVPLIILWAEEQVQIFKPEQQGSPIKNLPNIPFAPWRGKFAGMPVGGAVMEQISGLDAALSELANECTHILSEGLTIAHAFQVVMVCYLLLLGPLAAAFFAWPSVGRDLFRKAFASWVDGVVILSLWKFWWNIVLICMTVRCESGALNPFDPFEVYYLAAFLCILMFVPFNPFDFKPGEIVGNAMKHAEAVASKVAQGGKGGGSGGGGGKGGGKTMPG